MPTVWVWPRAATSVSRCRSPLCVRFPQRLLAIEQLRVPARRGTASALRTDGSCLRWERCRDPLSCRALFRRVRLRPRCGLQGRAPQYGSSPERGPAPLGGALPRGRASVPARRRRVARASRWGWLWEPRRRRPSGGRSGAGAAFNSAGERLPAERCCGRRNGRGPVRDRRRPRRSVPQRGEVGGRSSERPGGARRDGGPPGTERGLRRLPSALLRSLAALFWFGSEGGGAFACPSAYFFICRLRNAGSRGCCSAVCSADSALAAVRSGWGDARGAAGRPGAVCSPRAKGALSCRGGLRFPQERGCPWRQKEVRHPQRFWACGGRQFLSRGRTLRLLSLKQGFFSPFLRFGDRTLMCFVLVSRNTSNGKTFL